MGIGMVAIVSPNDAAAIGKQLRARVIGRIERGKGVVQLDSAGEAGLNVESSTGQLLDLRCLCFEGCREGLNFLLLLRYHRFLFPDDIFQVLHAAMLFEEFVE